MNDKQTCGPLYFEALKHFTGLDPEKIPLFAAGFICGQAEKVCLGACAAAMFRPSEEWQDMVYENVCNAAHIYGLYVTTLDTSRGREIWMYKSLVAQTAIESLSGLTENSPRWHQRRGLLCGVPLRQIDHAFHERHGYGEKCDGEAGA